MQRHVVSLIYISYLIIGTSGQLNLIQLPGFGSFNEVKYNSTFESHFESNFEWKFHRSFNSDAYVLNFTSMNLQSLSNRFREIMRNQEIVGNNLFITPVQNFEYLDLSRNRLLFCNFFNYGSEIQRFNLITLVIEENEAPRDSINREISNADCFPQVRYLYLRKNRIQRLNFSLRQAFPTLVSLYLSNNELDCSLFIQDVPSSLAYLYVENNRISSIDISITRYLKTLSADNNLIRSICYRNCESSSLQLLGTTGLEVLSLAGNKIDRIESCAFRDSWSLVCLNLANNELEEIQAPVLNSLRSLAQLNLDNNRLRSVPNLKGNWHLKALSLRNNRITSITREDFSSSTTLRKLLLGGNCIRSIHSNTFDDLTSLEMLDLSGNGIESLPSGWMRGLVNLKHLSLKNNKFTYVHQLSLRISLCLLELHLEDNRYTRSDEGSIQAYAPNARLYLDGCSYNSSSIKMISGYTYRTYWEMSRQEKSDFSYTLDYVST